MATLNYKNCKVVFFNEDGDENLFGNFIIKYDGFSEEVPFEDVIELTEDECDFCVDSEVQDDFFVESVLLEDFAGNVTGVKFLLTLK